MQSPERVNQTRHFAQTDSRLGFLKGIPEAYVWKSLSGTATDADYKAHARESSVNYEDSVAFLNDGLAPELLK